MSCLRDNGLAKSLMAFSSVKVTYKSAYQKNNCPISQPKHMLWVLLRNVSMKHVVGTQKNHLNEMVLLNTQNMLKPIGKKILKILRSKIVLSKPMLQCL